MSVFQMLYLVIILGDMLNSVKPVLGHIRTSKYSLFLENSHRNTKKQ